jgi:hypothetical protein
MCQELSHRNHLPVGTFELGQVMGDGAIKSQLTLFDAFRTKQTGD